jgi:ABC-2 type transport system permease protein
MPRIKENAVALYTIVHKEITRFLRIWTQTLLPSVISISLYFVIFGHLIGPKIGTMEGYTYMEYLVPGLIMMSIITNSYANVVASFFGAKFQRNIEEMLVSPMWSSTILWGFVLGGIARGVCIGLLVTIVSLFFTTLKIEHVGLTLLVTILTASLFSMAGLLNGIFAKKFDDINIVPTFILTPLTYLGGVFYSVNMLPVFWQGLTRLNPIFYMVNAFRYGMLGQSDVSIEQALLVIITFTLGTYTLAILLLKKGVGIRG